MKKTYTKPGFYAESLKPHSVTVYTCSDADNYWDPIPVGDSVVFVPDYQNCTVTLEFFAAHDGKNDNDGPCYYASTDDGKLMNS